MLDFDAVARRLTLEFPANSGMLAYGSALFRAVESVNDIDLLVLTNFSSRRRVVEIYEGKELHVNLVSADVLQDDLVNRRYGEYYVSKMMGPNRFLKQSTVLSEMVTGARKQKARDALMLAGCLCTAFTALDVVKLVTWLRMIQFPHYAASAITMFANSGSACFENLGREYTLALDALVAEGFLERRGLLFTMSRYSLGNSVHEWSKFMSLVPMYWDAFVEVHGGDRGTMDGYLLRHIMSLTAIPQREKLAAVEELRSSCFVDSVLARMSARKL